MRHVPSLAIATVALVAVACGTAARRGGGGDRRGGTRSVRFQDASCRRGNVCVRDW